MAAIGTYKSQSVWSMAAIGTQTSQRPVNVKKKKKKLNTLHINDISTAIFVIILFSHTHVMFLSFLFYFGVHVNIYISL